jgi:hypothetical protein
MQNFVQAVSDENPKGGLSYFYFVNILVFLRRSLKPLGSQEKKNEQEAHLVNVMAQQRFNNVLE